MAQINPTVGAINKNTQKILSIITDNQISHDVIIFPELALTGYPPEDLLFRDSLFEQCENALKQIIENTTQCHVIIGHPTKENNHRYNSASVIANKNQIKIYHKQHLPNYGVFDEKRYFSPGAKSPCTFEVKNTTLGVCICEDIWQKSPVEQLIAAKTNLIICINASPFTIDKCQQREGIVRNHAKRGVPIVYVNQVGGQDELVFDGLSHVADHKGNIVARAPAFAEKLQTVIFENEKITSEITKIPESNALIYQALKCGLGDYINKNNFPGVLIGLSGGIDSALTLAIAVDALGAERVHGVMMPSRYTASMSNEDAQEQLNTLNVKSTILPIEPAFKTMLATLAPAFNNKTQDTTEENLQARIRGMLLMAISNKTGNMVLTTSNKSETAVGYATLYGDMAGGFSVLKDILKTKVYDLARYRNSISKNIPERVITRAPSAELSANQTDQDSLPEYATIDAVITDFMEHNLSVNEIIRRGHAKDDVDLIIKKIAQNEYKRRQSSPGVKITARVFGRDWRYPITSGFDYEN